jgi:hypothetical protein
MNSTTVIKKGAIELHNIESGDVFSESSHYTFNRVDPSTGNYSFTHLESGEEVSLSPSYVTKFLSTADQYTETVKVGMLDKYWTQKQIDSEIFSSGKEPSVGDLKVPGIRTLFESIHSAKVFTVCFQKQDTVLTKKLVDAARKDQLERALDAIDKARTSKKGVAKVAEEQLQLIQNNPIQNTEPGELRELRGYKVQFDSVDGKYNCMDMELNQLRPVNINTIKWLVIDGVKYIVA